MLIAEVITFLLRNSDEIKGLSFQQVNIKLCQLADDMTLFLSSTKSVLHAINLFEEFYRYAGLKLNRTKTEAFLIDFQNPLVYQDKSIGIKWTVKPFRTLGTWFSLDSEETKFLNINEKMNIITSILKSWEHRHLTLKGKITILKSLVVPHILQLASVLPLSKKILCELERMLYDFAWENKRHLISKDTLILTYELGGLKMVSVKCSVDTVKIMFVKRLCNGVDAKWKVMAQELMGIHLNNICERRLIQSIKQNIKTEFY